MDREASYWSIITDPVLSSKTLKPNAKLLFAKITSLQLSRGYCYASNEYLGESIDVRPDTITRLLRQLSEEGYLDIQMVKPGPENGFTGREIYVLTSPSPSLKSTWTKNRPPLGQKSDPPSDICPAPLGQKSDQNKKEENNKENPPIVPQGDKRRREPKKQADHNPERFARFWKAYPRGEKKHEAIRAWDRLAPSDELCDTMAKALKRQMQSEDWQRGIGIPYASTWINQRRWEDEVKDVAPAPEMDTRGGLPAW